MSSKLELHKVLEGGRPTYVSKGEQAVLISELALSLEEAISRERARGEVLKIISGSNGELDKVIAAVLGYTLELCDAEFGILFEYAHADWLGQQGAFHVGTQTGLGRVVAHRDVVNIADVCVEEIYQHGDPLIGAFTVYRQQVRPFDSKSLEIARIFAVQSVIVIENARLGTKTRRGPSIFSTP